MSRVAVVGATGAVGKEILRCLDIRKFPVKELRLLASQRSAGQKVEFQGRDHTVRALVREIFILMLANKLAQSAPPPPPPVFLIGDLRGHVWFVRSYTCLCAALPQVGLLGDDSFEGIDVAFFSAGGSLSKRFAPAVMAAGAAMVDNSSAFRMVPGVPLVVPEVNPEALKEV